MVVEAEKSQAAGGASESSSSRGTDKARVGSFSPDSKAAEDDVPGGRLCGQRELILPYSDFFGSVQACNWMRRIFVGESHLLYSDVRLIQKHPHR